MNIWTHFGNTVRESEKGWIIQGNLTNQKFLLLFKDSGYGPGQDLNADHNDIFTVGQHIAFNMIGTPVKVLRAGRIAQAAIDKATGAVEGGIRYPVKNIMIGGPVILKK